MGPLKIISDGSLNTRTAWCCEPYGDAHRLEYPSGQPNLSGAGAARAARPRARERPRDRHATRSATRPSPRRSARTPTPARAGRSSTRRWPGATTCDGWPQLGIRASVQPAHLLDDRDLTEQDLGRAVGALLRLPLDARRRGRAGARLGRAGLAARPVAGDGGRRAPQRRRARAVARRAGADAAARRWPPRSTAPRWSARLAGRPGAARPRPAAARPRPGRHAPRSATALRDDGHRGRRDGRGRVASCTTDAEVSRARSSDQVGDGLLLDGERVVGQRPLGRR